MRGHRSELQLISRLDGVLPQTQCRQCGYAGCRPYAQAIAAGAADVNQCPPGGDEVARKLSALLGVAYKPLDARFGVTKPPALAHIDEALCIGCTLCIQACPVDAIAGAANMMHTVIARDCTGCELCLAPCPVSCIKMVATGAQPTAAQRQGAADRARARFESRALRLANRSLTNAVAPAEAKRATVQRAITRAKLRLARRKAASL